MTSTFDAAGRLIQTVSPQRRNNPPLVLTQAFDGDGRRVKKTEYGSTTYLLRSSVLSGVVITEIYGTAGQANFGQKRKGHVYSSGTELAEQNTFLNVAMYQHHEPSHAEQGMSYIHPDGTESGAKTQLDPLGDYVGDRDPDLDPGGGGDPLFVYPRFGDIADNPFGCTVDGEPWPCTFAFKYAAVRSSIIEVTPGPGAGLRSPRFVRVLNPSEAGGDACKDGVCPEGGVTVYDPGGHYEIAGYDIIDNTVTMRPQNSDRRLTTDETSALRSGIADLLSDPNCLPFINELLGKAGEHDKGNPPFSTDPLKLFDEINGKGGYNYSTSYGHNTVLSTLQYYNAAVLLIPPSSFGPGRWPGREQYIADTITQAGLHETLHLAGRNGQYSDQALARATLDIAAAHGWNLPSVADREKILSIRFVASFYWDGILRSKCKPSSARH